MNSLEIILIIIFSLLGLRLTFFWLRSWQLREYRPDRMRAYLQTVSGRRALLGLYFTPGRLPRPVFTPRALLVFFVTLLLNFIFGLFFYTFFTLAQTIIILSLLPFSLVSCASLLVALPAKIARLRKYSSALKVRKQSKNLTVIGITGSYGKSSTKEILAHLLTGLFGSDNLLYTPKNNNTELAIANLVLKNQTFFTRHEKRIFLFEVGAYSRGEIKTVADFALPHYAILTGINSQHIELFGSQKNIIKAKLELAEKASEKIFYNSNSSLLKESVSARSFSAPVTPSYLEETKSLLSDLEKTTFTYKNQTYLLPWPGEFFVQNALLAIKICLELGASSTEIAAHLKTLPPQKNALHLKKLNNGGTVLFDLYAANPSGVLSAINHLRRFSGRKIFVGIPLRELGEKAPHVHKKIFTELKNIHAEVFWFMDDFASLAKEIIGPKFHGPNLDLLKKIKSELKQNDAVLLESRLPTSVTNLFHA